MGPQSKVDGLEAWAEKLEGFRDLGALFEFLPETQFWIKDRESRFISCNKAFLRHFGMRDMEQLKGRSDRDVSAPALAEEYILDDRKVEATGKPIVEKMELVREADDSVNWYATTKTPLRDGRGVVIGTAGFTRRVRPAVESDSPASSMERAIRRMNTHYHEPLSIPSLAALAGMSVDNFERRFRSLMRETPLKYLTRIRMRAACGLLIHTGMPIADVAVKAGFSDPSYFARRFQIHLRIRPMEYRKKYSAANRGATGVPVRRK